MTQVRRVSKLVALLALSAASAHAGQAAYVKAELSTARAEPDGETLAEAKRGDGYAVLKRQGEWVQVQFTDEPAWLPMAEVEVKDDVALKRVASSEAIVRSGPSRTASVLGRLVKGTPVVERRGFDRAAFREISYGGKRAYVPGACLESERRAQPTCPVPQTAGRAGSTGAAPAREASSSSRGAAGSAAPGGSSPWDGKGGGSSPWDGSGGGSSPWDGSGGGSSPWDGSGGGSSPWDGSGGGSPFTSQERAPAETSSAVTRTEQEPAAPGRRVPAQTATPEDLEILARIVKGEALQCSHQGKVAVAAVVLNRVRAPGFPKTIRGVAHQPKQFSCYNPQFRLRLYYGEVPESCWAAAREALAGNDPSNGATYYFNPYLVKPSWARGMVRVARIGTGRNDTHEFYKPR